MVFAERDSDGTGAFRRPAGCAQRLSYADARALFDSTNLGVFDERVRDRVIAETHGNPLALDELPRALDPRVSRAGSPVSDGSPLEGRIEASFRVGRSRRRRSGCSSLARPSPGSAIDASLASRRGGRPFDRNCGARGGGRADRDRRARHVSPSAAALRDLQRSAFATPTGGARRLADATDPELDPDRRAWHRAHAALAPDEDVAADLERSADRARAWGLPAAAEFLERAVKLTPDARRRTERALDAAPSAAGRLRRRGRRAGRDRGTRTADRSGASLAVRMRALIAWDARPDYAATLQLLDAARQLEPYDVDPRATHISRPCSEPVTPGGSAKVYRRTLRQLGELHLEPDAGHERPAPRRPGRALHARPFGGGSAAEGRRVAAREDRGDDEHALRGARIASRVAAELMDEQAWEEIASSRAVGPRRRHSGPLGDAQLPGHAAHLPGQPRRSGDPARRGRPHHQGDVRRGRRRHAGAPGRAPRR